jgi:hypothetical protein
MPRFINKFIKPFVIAQYALAKNFYVTKKIFMRKSAFAKSQITAAKKSQKLACYM